MSTSTFDASNSSISWLGQYADFPLSSQTARNIKGLNSEIRFKATGTDLTIRCLVTTNGTNYLTVSVDGGGATNLSMSGLTANTWSDVTVFSGLTDTQHTVVIRHNTGTQTNVAFQLTSTLSLTGASPALATADNCGAIYAVGTYPFLANAMLEGGVLYPSSISSGYFYPPNITFPWGDGLFRFKANATSISVWALQNAAKYALFQDGTQVATLTLASGNAYGLQVIATGLSGTHDYEIVCVASPTVAGQINQLILGGGTQQTATYTARRGSLVTVGDSIVGGNGTGTGGDSSLNWPYKLARLKGYQSQNRGTSGQRLVPSSTTAIGLSFRWPDVLWSAVNPGDPPAYVLIEIGHNDAAASVSTTDFQAQYLQMITGIAAVLPSAKVLCLAIPATTAFNSTVQGNYNTCISNAVTALGNANVTYVDTTTWTNSGGDTSDGTHLTAAGADKWVTQLSSLVTSWVAPSSGGIIKLAGFGGGLVG